MSRTFLFVAAVALTLSGVGPSRAQTPFGAVPYGQDDSGQPLFGPAAGLTPVSYTNPTTADGSDPYGYGPAPSAPQGILPVAGYHGFGRPPVAPPMPTDGPVPGYGPMSMDPYGPPSPALAPPGLGQNVKPLPWLEIGGDYVLLFYQKLQMPFPTLTVGRLTDAIPGALDQLGTDRLYPLNENDPRANAFRPRVVIWLPSGFSFEGNMILAEQKTQLGTVTSEQYGARPLGRPYFNPVSQTNEVFPISFISILEGSASDSTMARILGGEANLRYTWGGQTSYDPGFYFTPLAGWRWLTIQERYENFDRVGSVVDGSQNYFSDRFTTYNNFMGGQVGIMASVQAELMKVDGFLKLAMGMNNRTIDISGFSVVTDPFNGDSIVDPTRGNYAQPSNIGRKRDSTFALLPEAGVNLNYSFNQRWTFRFGYNAMLLSNMVRPSSQIDYSIDPQAVQGGVPAGILAPRPSAFVNQTMWIQMISLGAEFRF